MQAAGVSLGAVLRHSNDAVRCGRGTVFHRDGQRAGVGFQKDSLWPSFLLEVIMNKPSKVIDPRTVKKAPPRGADTGRGVPHCSDLPVSRTRPIDNRLRVLTQG